MCDRKNRYIGRVHCIAVFKDLVDIKPPYSEVSKVDFTAGRRPERIASDVFDFT